MLRGADKSNWHHRMVVRVGHQAPSHWLMTDTRQSARTIYDESPNDHMATLAAKHELTQQIFTKTMTVQVWKPDNERTGRHFVYTTRYVQFFLRLLYELNDRAGVEALGRQIRKKPGKFFGHTRLWQELCMTHLKVRTLPVNTLSICLTRSSASPHTFNSSGRALRFGIQEHLPRCFGSKRRSPGNMGTSTVHRISTVRDFERSNRT